MSQRRLSARPFVSLLPLWQRVIFVDWHGVLSSDPYWASILENRKHPYHERLKEGCDRLFSREGHIVDSWMRGLMKTEQVVSVLEDGLDRRCRADFLKRRLYEDCKRMRLNRPVVEVLREASRHSFVVLATDNTDSFFDAVDGIHELRLILDAVLCSSVLGILKSEDPQRFFGPWLQRHRLQASQAVLIDDSPLNCQRFEEIGGKAIVADSTDNVIGGLRLWLDER